MARALTAVLIVITIAAGCAKRPVTVVASAPSPTKTTSPGAAAASGGGQRPASKASSSTPPAQRARPSQFAATTALRDTHFEFDRYDLRPADTKVLDMNAAWLRDNSNALLLIEGHADERGTNEYNLALGERRAKAAVDYLVAQGVRGTRIEIISYGEERPLCVQRTEACWTRNRRAHFLVKAE
jgi:peptidoglycan-associated lipoprotein